MHRLCRETPNKQAHRQFLLIRLGRIDLGKRMILTKLNFLVSPLQSFPLVFESPHRILLNDRHFRYKLEQPSFFLHFPDFSSFIITH